MSANPALPWAEMNFVPGLGQSEIHVWRISLEAQPDAIAEGLGILTAEERGRAVKFHFQHDQRRFVIRRAVLRQLLAAYLNGSPLEVQLETGMHGKPFVAGQPESNRIIFNCSHSGDLALVAVARGIELGVDLQQHQPMADAEDLARNYFSESEIRELASLPDELKSQGFFNCWSRKEAFIKALGLGLSYPLNRFSVSLIPGRPALLLEVAGDPGAREKWSMISLDDILGNSAALVHEGKTAGIKFFQWRQ